MAQNPKWNREELILALDLYITARPKLPGKSSKEVGALSALLKNVRAADALDSTFRSESSVYKKLCNFMSFDPSCKGKGLPKSGKLDKVIWEEYFGKGEELRREATLILQKYQK